MLYVNAIINKAHYTTKLELLSSTSGIIIPTQELKAEVKKKLRVDKQQQLEGMCAELSCWPDYAGNSSLRSK